MSAATLTLPPVGHHNAGAGLRTMPRGYDSLADAELVARWRDSGDRRAFDTLYRRHRRRVIAVALGLVRDPAAAEDLCHEAFLRAWNGIGGLRGEVEPWLVRIVQNLALNHLRNAATRHRLDGALPTPIGEPVPEHQAATREEGRIAAAILGELAPEQRRAMVLRYLDGLSRAEIAARTGTSEDAVRSQLQNGRRNFRLAWARRMAATEDRQ